MFQGHQSLSLARPKSEVRVAQDRVPKGGREHWSPVQEHVTLRESLGLPRHERERGPVVLWVLLLLVVVLSRAVIVTVVALRPKTSEVAEGILVLRLPPRSRLPPRNRSPPRSRRGSRRGRWGRGSVPAWGVQGVTHALQVREVATVARVHQSPRDP